MTPVVSSLTPAKSHLHKNLQKAVCGKRSNALAIEDWLPLSSDGFGNGLGASEHDGFKRLVRRFRNSTLSVEPPCAKLKRQNCTAATNNVRNQVWTLVLNYADDYLSKVKPSI